MTVDSEIARLIGLLDAPSTDVAEAAKAELMTIGVEAIEQLVAAVPSLDRFGQLSAIEVFEHFRDQRAAPVLVQLLKSEHDTVRERILEITFDEPGAEVYAFTFG